MRDWGEGPLCGCAAAVPSGGGWGERGGGGAEGEGRGGSCRSHMSLSRLMRQQEFYKYAYIPHGSAAPPARVGEQAENTSLPHAPAAGKPAPTPLPQLDGSSGCPGEGSTARCRGRC
uniref:Uncharacterized protein n=1 Tax=Tetraselmis sp. GSL018 TaxID=582737 RepID=A0A061QP42_9CHLO